MMTLRGGGSAVPTALLPRLRERFTEHETVGADDWSGELVCRRGSTDPSGALLYYHADGPGHRALVVELALRTGLPVLRVTHDTSHTGAFTWLTGLGIRPGSVVLTGASAACEALVALLQERVQPAGIVRLSPELSPDERAMREISDFVRRIADGPPMVLVPEPSTVDPVPDPFPPMPARTDEPRGRHTRVPGQHRAYPPAV